MCLNHDLTTQELRALLSDAIATARRTRDGLDDALHAMLATPSLATATASPGGETLSPAAVAGDPDEEKSA